MLKQWRTRAVEEHDVLLFLIGYRWLALLPPLLSLFLSPSTDTNRGILLLAFADNLFLSIFHPRVNRVVTRVPLSFAFDLVLVAILLTLTGGSSSPYYLFALSPVLASAFFFQLRGAILTASTFTVFYLAALVIHLPAFDVLSALEQVISFYLIAVLFGYASILVARNRAARALLAQNNATL